MFGYLEGAETHQGDSSNDVRREGVKSSMSASFKTSSLFLLVLALLCAPAGTSWGATIDAASCSYEDVSAAVQAATWGDTVRVPAGEADWGESSLVVTKGIELLGAGSSQTIISSTLLEPETYAYLISFEADETTAANDQAFKLDGFTLKANGSYPPYGLLRLSNPNYPTHLSKVVVSNNVFQQLVDSGYTSFAIGLYPGVFGVTFHNEIVDGDHAWRFLGSLESGKTVEHWEPGSPYAMYFEDNYIHLSEPWGSTLIISGGGGNRYVSRYNTFDASVNGPDEYTQAHDIHGNQPNNPGAGIGFEAYGELRLGGVGRWFDERGGQVYFFMNQWTESGGSGSYYVWEEYDDDTFTPSSCEGLNYPTTAGGTNCLQRARDSYFWRNFGGESGTTLSTSLVVQFDYFDRSIEPPTVNEPLTLFENQSWWRDTAEPFTGAVEPVGSCGYYEGPSCQSSGIGCGTLADMQAIETCTEGVGFWVTSQGTCDDLSGYVGHDHTQTIEGTLYRCNAANGWEPVYVPYTYPHPLRAGEGGAGGAGGSGASGGAGGSAGDAAASGDEEGCSCGLPGTSQRSRPWPLALGLAFSAAAAVRRRRRS